MQRCLATLGLLLLLVGHGRAESYWPYAAKRVPDPTGHPTVAPGDGDLEEAAKELRHGSVVIAAITSCTNTSNPSVMLAAGLLAKKAVERGLHTKPWVKTSLAPGSKVVTDYLARAGLIPYLDALGFNLVGYGCTTCIGNSGPLPDDVSAIVDLAVSPVSGQLMDRLGRLYAVVPSFVVIVERGFRTRS